MISTTTIIFTKNDNAQPRPEAAADCRRANRNFIPRGKTKPRICKPLRIFSAEDCDEAECENPEGIQDALLPQMLQIFFWK